MRVVLVDLKGSDGFVNKDRVAGGYGNRLRPFSFTTRILTYFKARYHDLPSIQMGYLAAILARGGADVRFTNDEPMDGDVAIVLSSLVDYRRELAFADTMRARGVRVGFIGLAASKLPHLFAEHADFVVQGEPEAAISRMAAGEKLEGLVDSPQINDLDALPFPRWDLIKLPSYPLFRSSVRTAGGFPVLASRGCPEFCTYCSHRILAGYRTRSVGNIADEVEQLAERFRRPYVVFRDALFTENRERCLALCDEIEARSLRIRFECETRTDRLDTELLRRLHRVGLRRVVFGVESVSPETLTRVGRRPTPPEHQMALVAECRRLGVATVGMFMLGFLTDDWRSIAATIEFATELNPTVASFKIVTPYPATPMWKQMEPLLVEHDLEKFDGYTVTFAHPNLTTSELRFLLAAAYSRFYLRPSYLADLLKVKNRMVLDWAHRMDIKVSARQARKETARMSRPVAC
jgi:radical SAM superfamily enzyme YgiQ (UPF0313 family)